ISTSQSERFFFTPMPLQLWMVIPCTWVAAIPVEAVTAGSTPRSRSHSMYLLIVCVLPLPGSPVKKTFTPSLSIESASSCVIGEALYQKANVSPGYDLNMSLLYAANSKAKLMAQTYTRNAELAMSHFGIAKVASRNDIAVKKNVIFVSVSGRCQSFF